MRADPTFLQADPTADEAAEADAMAFSAQLGRMIAVAQALVANNRRIDVDGLQNQIGILCARALDLPPSRTGLLKLELVRLMAALDALAADLRAHAA